MIGGIKILEMRPGFLRPKLKVLGLSVALFVVGNSYSEWKLKKDAQAEDRYLEPECSVIEVLNRIESHVRNAHWDSINIERGVGKIPNSRMSFRTKDGNLIRYYSAGDCLYCTRNNDRHKVLSDVLAVYFIPSTTRHEYLEVELKVWKVDQKTGDPKVVTLGRKFWKPRKWDKYETFVSGERQYRTHPPI